MVNATFNFCSIAGLIAIGWGVSVEILKRNKYLLGSLLTVSGAITFLQGWRLDPILQGAYIILLTAYLIQSKGLRS